MSTRSTMHFLDSEEKDATPEAIVYRHYDGYPEGAGTDIYRFFQAVEKATSDTRFNDPTYLAAKYVVWQAGEFGQGLQFLGVGVMQRDPLDIEYRYVIECAKLDADGRPTVTCYPVDCNWDTQEFTREDPVEIPRPEAKA